MQKIKLSESQYIQVIQDFMIHGGLDLEYYMVLKNIFVHKATDTDDCNIEYVKSHGYYFQELPRQGGTIVGFPGDVECIYFMLPNEYTGMPKEIQNLLGIIFDKGYTPIINGNDVLINNYKVASWSFKKINDYFLVAIVASVNIDLDIIQHICLKPMEKIPKGLSEFGITTEDVKRAFEVE